jgi:hypothetical protein
VTGRREPARHERPLVDDAALVAARDAEQLLAAAESRGAERWVAFLRPLPEQLRDAGLAELRRVAMRARAAYGPKDSIREALPAELTEPFLDHLDRLLKALARDALEAAS